jgi:hypothetical protein
MDDAGNTKDDMKLPAEEELAKEARASLTQRCSHACASLATRAAVVLRAALTLPLALLQIKTGFDEGKELVVTVLKVSCVPCSVLRQLLASTTRAPHAPCQTGHGRGGHPRCEGGCQVGALRSRAREAGVLAHGAPSLACMGLPWRHATQPCSRAVRAATLCA